MIIMMIARALAQQGDASSPRIKRHSKPVRHNAHDQERKVGLLRSRVNGLN